MLETEPRPRSKRRTNDAEAPMEGAAQQDDEPVEALELKMPHDAPGVINVRFAGYRRCYADTGMKERAF